MARDKEKENLINKIPLQSIIDEIIVPDREDYYEGTIHNFDYNRFIKCPLQDENTPSFHYYPETNTFYCFACGRYGGPISLYKQYRETQYGENLKIEDVVKFLYDYFIKDNSAAVLVDTSTNEISLNDKIKYINYKKLTIAIENILRELQLGIKDKEKYFYILDTENYIVTSDPSKVDESKERLLGMLTDLAEENNEKINNGNIKIKYVNKESMR